MFQKRHRGLLAAIMLISALGFAIRGIQLSAQPGASDTPDVIVGDIPSVMRWGGLGDETAFSIATTSCNIGTAPLDWLPSPSPKHPVITQNLYRVSNGRIEQIGMSWLKHGFAVAAGNLCAQCQDFSSNRLGVNCSDPYSAGLNGSQSGVGPRSEVNAATGVFAVPFAQLPHPRNILDGRIRVQDDDLDPVQNAGARYFVESQYVHPQDASAGNSANNASYREVFVDARQDGTFHLNVNSNSPTERMAPAIMAWKSVHADAQIAPPVDIGGDGRVLVAYRTEPSPMGGFRTSIAVENLTSHRSIRGLSVTFSEMPSNPAFFDVDYQHEPYSNSDWTPQITGSTIRWETESFATNEDANALRWGTLYSFACDSPSRPTAIQLELFRPGASPTVNVPLGPVVGPESFTSVSVDWASIQRSVDLGSLSQDQPASFRFTCKGNGVRSIESIDTTNSSIQTDFSKSEDDNTERWKVTVKPSGNAAQGYFESVLHFQSDHEADTPISVRVYGNIE